MGEEESEDEEGVSAEVVVVRGGGAGAVPHWAGRLLSGQTERRGSWPRPGPLPSSFQPPSGDAGSTCNCLSHARLQRQA